MLNRLLLLIHWIGFLCLFSYIGGMAFGLIFNDYFVITNVIPLFVDQLSFEEGWRTVILWIAILHWPFNWIVTGNKAFFPWRRNQ